ncbi:MAG TPA: diol dehydratase small subunit [Bryobacteraceae bacterium]|nr:diol dehydratase small subunit [Bryobacteraceae bacterium]
MPEYPLAEKSPEILKTPSGLAFAEITLDAVLEGKVRMEDLRVTAEALELQAQVADAAGRRQLGENLRRAAELVVVPEEQILKIYQALRPGRASRAELLGLAAELEREFGARRCAELIREAAG